MTSKIDIRFDDEIEYCGVTDDERLWCCALEDMRPGLRTLIGNSITTPGLRVTVRIADIVSVQRVVPGKGTVTVYQREVSV